ncbi:type II secretion system F family protein [Marinomonas sp. 2405UD66-6]|uniref:type II secretion system F family protein n=1 Tax=Marinomonas sp. 2405UD66-6 TaxID=3391834 RepID=UPI0039C8CB1E
MIYLLMLFIGLSGVCISYSMIRSARFKRYSYLNEFTKVTRSQMVGAKQQAVDLKSLSGHSFLDRQFNKWKNLREQLGKFALVKVAVFYAFLLLLSRLINSFYLPINPDLIFLVIAPLGSWFAYDWLQNQERRAFEETFPVALNMLTSAVSSGESITQAISYVGESLDGKVGNEFRSMGQRLQMGESPDDVFRKACLRLSYPTFYFFVITLRANMERGGQLKDIIQRLNRLMFNMRSIEKKKYALTAEARASVKIVAAIPFIFLLGLRFIQPENFEYIMFNPNGNMILYYMLVSEFIGISIVWGLMKGVK